MGPGPRAGHSFFTEPRHSWSCYAAAANARPWSFNLEHTHACERLGNRAGGHTVALVAAATHIL